MNKLKSILKVYVINNFGINALHEKNKRKRIKMISFVAVLVFAFISLAFTSFMYSQIMADVFEQYGRVDILLGIMMAASSLLIFFTTMYKAASILFNFRDYDTLMSMPIKTRTIITSRIIILYSFNIAMMLIIMIPAVITYCLRVNPPLMFYVMFVLTLILIPMIPILAASILGSMLSLIASRFKRKNGLNTILLLLFFVGIMVANFSLQGTIINFDNAAKPIVTSISSIYPFAFIYMNAICDLKLTSILTFVGSSVAVFGMFVYLVSIWFKTMHTTLASIRTSSNYKMKELKTSSQFAAIFMKERKRFFSSPLYVLNAGVGSIMLVILAIAVTVFGAEEVAKFMEMPEISGTIGMIAPLIISLFAALSCTTACSVSLEGKTFWITKSMPVSTKKILLGKIALNLMLSVPTIIISAALFSMVLKTDLMSTILMFVTPIAYAFFIAIFGLYMNLLMPKMSWTHEAQVIKQSAAVMVVVFGGMLMAAAPIAIVILVANINILLVNLITTCVIALASIILYFMLMKDGIKRFRAID